eukprot:CAMPEP_0114381832 /NCGR_PEP_ID=MMETSP0102-20121206/3696_1 /TAXON_ID=38822 ORGANISM="Pteridomonas danica, Strain PT" /NCGR_SAMPLE_ID=MMETSP0102 /ASSEMBLY_ACC=CAM_ASM_000212 /LENGTH=586 /DNA_ID=CAMNT_0001537413 /DNA_START=249 /DNA_END=2009 /DNA_ORIENTATION=+
MDNDENKNSLKKTKRRRKRRLTFDKKWNDVEQWLNENKINNNELVKKESQFKEMIPQTPNLSTIKFQEDNKKDHNNKKNDDNDVKTRSGAYLWEKGKWEGSIISTCHLLEELTGQSSEEPIMEKTIKNCPIDKCLSYGKQLNEKNPEGESELVLGMEPFREVTTMVKSLVSIKHLKSSCYHIPGRSKEHGIDEETMLCDTHGGRKIACCEGEYHVAGSASSSQTRHTCVGCLPHFYSIGPQKTGTTDLYNRIAMLKGVVPAHRKETAWWSEGILNGPRHKSLAGYMLKYFPHMSLTIEKHEKGMVPISQENSPINKYRDGRRLGNLTVLDRRHEFDVSDSITGEATPSMLTFQHKGLSLIPRWLRCIYAPAKIIITLRDPIERTYSDFKFYGKLQASKGFVKPENREAYVMNLNAQTFDRAMREEVHALRQCFETDTDTGGLVFQSSLTSDCESIRKNQLEMLGFQSKRVPGRLLVSLYPMHIALWLRYFPCQQLLVVRSEGTWTEPVMRAIALFLEVDPASASKAAAVSSVSPEQFSFSREANQLASGLAHRNMLNSTRTLLADFFEDHWLARFPEASNQVETCI